MKRFLSWLRMQIQAQCPNCGTPLQTYQQFCSARCHFEWTQEA